MTNLRLMSTLPQKVEACRQQVLAWLRKSHLSDTRVICVTNLSTFVDPTFGSNCEIKEAIITLAIVRGSKLGRIFAAIIDTAEPYAEQTHRILTSLGVKCYSGEMGCEAVDSFLREVSSTLSDKRPTKVHERRVTNLRERKLITNVKRALGILPLERSFRVSAVESGYAHLIHHLTDYIEKQRRLYDVFEEYALSRIVDADDLPNISHIRTFRVDILVAEAAPSAVPLFVLEFDGMQHLRKDVAWKDSKRDEVLLAGGLPIIRISSRNNTDERFFELFIGYFVSEIVRRIQSARNRSEPWSVSEEVNEFELLLSKYRKTSQQTNVPIDLLAAMLAKARAHLEQNYNYATALDPIEEMERLNDWSLDCNPELVLSRAGFDNVSVVRPFRTEGEIGSDDGFSVSCEVSISSDSHSIISPKVYVSMRTSDEYRRLELNVACIDAAKASVLLTFADKVIACRD